MINVNDYKKTASKVLPRMLSDFVNGGALAEQTLERNNTAFSRYRLRPRAFCSSSDVDLHQNVLGATIRSPVLIAPTGASGLLWPRGEIAAARAAHASQTIMQVSAGSILSMEEIAGSTPGPKWLQLFLYRDRGLTLEFMARAKKAGYTALMVTTDAPTHGLRERDMRNNFTIDRRLSMRNVLDAIIHWRWSLRMVREPRFGLANFKSHSDGNMSEMASYIASVLDPDVTWNDFSWLRDQWDGPLIVKGISHPADAKIAVQRGADAIQVSNHGGRQLDGGVSTLDALAAVCDEIAADTPVLLDGGITRGTDVLKAIALGATACVIGRAHLWGMATAGEAGVTDVLRILHDEMRNTMTIGGWKSLKDLNRDSIMTLPM